MAVKHWKIDGEGVAEVKSNIPISRLEDILGGDSSGVGALYSRVAWLYRAAQIRADAVGSMPREVFRGDDVVDEAELPFSLTALLRLVELHLILYGAAYVYVVKNRRGGLVGLRALAPHTITPVSTAKDGVIGYRRHVGGDNRQFALDELAAVWLPNPLAELEPGVAPAAVAMRAAGILDKSAAFQERFYRNGAIFPQLLTVVGATTESEVDKMQTFVNRNLSGLNNAFRTLFVRREIQSTTLGQPIRDLALEELTAAQRADVAAALGVPAVVIDGTAANYATAAQADLDFYTKTVIPACGLIFEALNSQLFGAYDLQIVARPMALEVMQAQELDKALKLDNARLRGDVTRNEWRAVMGFEPIEDDEAAPVSASPFNEVEDEADELAAALRNWQKKAVRRLAENKRDKMLEFEHAAITPMLKAQIVGGLEAAQSVEDVRAVFVGAEAWYGYG